MLLLTLHTVHTYTSTRHTANNENHGEGVNVHNMYTQT